MTMGMGHSFGDESRVRKSATSCQAEGLGVGTPELTGTEASEPWWATPGEHSLKPVGEGLQRERFARGRGGEPNQAVLWPRFSAV
jgi:hypothetical protein